MPHDKTKRKPKPVEPPRPPEEPPTHGDEGGGNAFGNPVRNWPARDLP